MALEDILKNMSAAELAALKFPTLESYSAALGFVPRYNDEGNFQGYQISSENNGDSGPRNFRSGEDGEALRDLRPYYDEYLTGRWGLEPYSSPNLAGQTATGEQLMSQVFQGADGRYYMRTGSNTPFDEQMREVGGQPGDVINDPRYGGGIEVGLANRVAARFRQDGWGEKILNNMPIIAGAIFAGAAASGALGGAGAAAGEGAGYAAAAESAAGAVPAVGSTGNVASWSMLAGDAAAAAGSGAGTLGATGATTAGATGGASAGLLPSMGVQFGSTLSLTPEVVAGLQGLGYSAAEIAAAGGSGALAAGGFAGGLGGAGAAATGATGSGFFDLAKSALGTPGVSQLLSGGLQSLGGYLGSQAQANAVGDANDLLWRQYQQNREDLTPYRMAGYGALGGLVDMTTPGKQLDRLRLDPGYDFRLSEGQQALDSKLRAGGKFYSGTGIKAAADYNQNSASNEFNSAYNRLAALAGTGQSAANTTAQLGQNTAQQAANNTVDIGNARASGYGAIAGGLSGALNSYNNAQQTQQLFDLLSKRS